MSNGQSRAPGKITASHRLTLAIKADAKARAEEYANRNRPQTFTAPCLGCADPITYVITVERGVGPEVMPEGHVTAYRDGHLCSGCTDAVNALLRGRTEAPAAACGRCGGWTSFGGMSQHAKATTPVQGRVGCSCTRGGR